MVKRSLRQSWLRACLAILTLLFFAAPSSLSAARPPGAPDQVYRHVNLQDTGETVALPVGKVLVVTLPLQPYDDNYWYIARNSGGALKLIAGPITRRPPNWRPAPGVFSGGELMYSLQEFRFQRVSPGTANLVLEQSYWSKPMVLRVVDR